MSYPSKDSQVQARKLKVQRLSIPLVITGNATPASVLLRNDEPGILFLRSEGVNQITAALDAGETATYATAADDSDGIFQLFVKVQEVVSKVIVAKITSRTTGVSHPCYLGDADGLSSAGNIMLLCDSTIDFSAASLDACLEVSYIVAE